MNIEQTKYLNGDDLSLLLGSVLRFPTPQREQLKRLSTPATVDAVLRWNLAQLEGSSGSDLYLDPYTKHYTGMQAVLKGWCSSIGWADKAVQSDFVHTSQDPNAGQPGLEPSAGALGARSCPAHGKLAPGEDQDVARANAAAHN